MSCGRCGLQWDVDDQERPQCRTDKELSKEKGLQALHDMREGLEVDIVHTCSNCEFNEIQQCAYKHWGAGSGVDRDALAILMNVDNSKCPRWRLKR
jgi:hypothetical protein